MLLNAVYDIFEQMKNLLTPNNLDSNGYEEHARLAHQELIVFVKDYFFRNNFIILFYWLFNIIIVVSGIYLIFSSPAVGIRFEKLLLGIAAFFLLIPVHELIHGLGYKLAGAPKVSYKAVWRQMVFYAMADQFVARKKAFILLAIAPFLLLNSLLIYLFFSIPEPYSWIAYGALLMHTAGCSGDFALMSYFITYWDKDPVTYDIVDGGVTFFYLKKD